MGAATLTHWKACNGKGEYYSFRQADDGTRDGGNSLGSAARNHRRHLFPEDDVLDREKRRAVYPADTLDCGAAG